MAYDKALKDKIDAMGAGELVHFMLATFDPRLAKEDDEIQGPWMQSNGYMWAHDRLNAVLPGKENADATV